MDEADVFYQDPNDFLSRYMFDESLSAGNTIRVVGQDYEILPLPRNSHLFMFEALQGAVHGALNLHGYTLVFSENVR